MKKSIFISICKLFTIFMLSLELVTCSTNDDSSSNNQNEDISGGEGKTSDTEVPLSNYAFHETITYLDAGTDGTAGITATYCYFGDWPQTVISDEVTVDETKSITMGNFTYFVGSDDNYYVKCNENAYKSGYTYSSGETIAQSSSNKQRYFKVEPIKWRVLNPTENSGNKILLAENILTASAVWYGYAGNAYSPEYYNNYRCSNIRAFLNGIQNQFVSDGRKAREYDIDWTDRGFLQTAFTNTAQKLIAITTVDNGASSTNPASNSNIWNNGSNLYTCANTEDKIFLLSEREVSTSKYGFADYSESGTGNSRIRFPTDYAKAKYAYKSYKAEEGGNWWLRSPHYSASNQALCVDYDGDLVNMRVGGVPKTPAAGYVSDEQYGIVPALSILE